MRRFIIEKFIGGSNLCYNLPNIQHQTSSGSVKFSTYFCKVTKFADFCDTKSHQLGNQNFHFWKSGETIKLQARESPILQSHFLKSRSFHHKFRGGTCSYFIITVKL